MPRDRIRSATGVTTSTEGSGRLTEAFEQVASQTNGPTRSMTQGGNGYSDNGDPFPDSEQPTPG